MRAGTPSGGTSAPPSWPAMRTLLRLGSSALVLVLIMFLGSLVMWVGIPLGWLWVASQVQAATDSLGAALGAGMLGVLVSLAVVVPLLGWLNDQHRALRVARGHDDTGNLVLEVVIVTSAGVAVVGFSAWFLLFSGANPIPLGINP
jgi:hypothetical protein